MVEWANQAVEDLQSIVSFIKKDSVFYAKKVYEDILDKVELLANRDKKS